MQQIPIWPDIRLIQKPDTGYPVRLDTGTRYPAGFSAQIEISSKYEINNETRFQENLNRSI
jgi:hypothetical protein